MADGGDVLLTGATGFVGMELLLRYLERTDRTVLALVRASDRTEANARIGWLLSQLLGERAPAAGNRVIAVPADIEREGLGLSDADLELVTARATEIVHCAASVSFQTGLAESRRINVEGTRRVLELACSCTPRRFAHVSTAYVAGEHAGMFGEDDLDVGQRFRNPYERSKYEAERLVRRHSRELPAVTIVRPSIVVGESTTGWTPAFNVLYQPLRAFAAGELRALPAIPSAPVDVVPVDYVADALLELMRDQQPGLTTYHLVAGERATTVRRLIELSARQLRRRPPVIVPPRPYRAAYPLVMACVGERRRAALRRAAPFLPYYTMRVRYRQDRAESRLSAAGLRSPAIESYYPRLVDYAAAARWGKRPLPRHTLT